MRSLFTWSTRTSTKPLLRAVVLLSTVIATNPAQARKSEAVAIVTNDSPAFLVVPVMPLKGKVGIAALPKSHAGAPKWLLTTEGTMIPLTAAQWSETKVEGRCGDGEPDPAKLKLADGRTVRGRLAVVGKGLDKRLTWTIPDSSNEDGIGCHKYLPGYRAKKTTVWSLGHLPISIQRTQLVGPDSAAKECPKDFHVVTVSAGPKNGACKALHWNLKDCDRQSTTQTPELRSLQGVLSLEGNDHWLIFESSGYESFGFTALQIDSFRSLNVVRETTMHPWGC